MTRTSVLDSSSGMGIQQVDAGGNGQVVGTGSNQTYCLTRTNASAYREVADMSWQSLSWTMQYYSCGPFGCWGVDSSHKVYFTQVGRCSAVQ